MKTVVEQYNLRNQNTFGINAFCDYWIEFTEAEDIPNVMATLPAPKYRCIGQGSNMLFVNDFRGALLHSRILDMEMSTDDNDVLIRIGSGISFDEVVERTCMAGLWGVENLSGIPGDAGAAAVQNIGAYGVEIKDVIEKVEAYDAVLHKFVEFSNSECAYDYRYSLFKSPENIGRYIISNITIRVSSLGSPRLDYGNLRNKFDGVAEITPMDVRKCVLDTRDAKLPNPLKIGSAGSFFKNPIVNPEVYRRIANNYPECNVPHYQHNDKIKIPAAWLIEQCGWKGKQMGNAGVWHLQPLVLINATGLATGKEIESLEQAIIQDVKQKFDITLHPEADHIY